MKKVQLNFEIIALNGDKIGHAGETVAGLLMSEIKGDAIKYYDWALQFQAKKEVQMDASDFSKLKSLVTDSERMVVLVKAQLIKYFDSVK